VYEKGFESAVLIVQFEIFTSSMPKLIIVVFTFFEIIWYIFQPVSVSQFLADVKPNAQAII